ncbi:hypothetical protein E2C01_048242 [Portunus trituberculatus]|uniref:Uncharacterized protein n=1 Tax=Portunus trituberculatus TaxID=210409 RepID=A0A5B7G5W5_PORTR|nr:hypothetical protein [Portunus trituberculatus]
MINPLYQYHECHPPPTHRRLPRHHSILHASCQDSSLSSAEKTHQSLSATALPVASSLTTPRNHDPLLKYLVLEEDNVRGTSRPLPITTIGYQDHFSLAAPSLTPTDTLRLPSEEGDVTGKLQQVPCVPHCRGHTPRGFFVKGAETRNLKALKESWCESVSSSATFSRPRRKSLTRTPSVQTQLVSLPATYTHSFCRSSFRRPIALPSTNLHHNDNHELSPPTARLLVASEAADGWCWKGDASVDPRSLFPLKGMTGRGRGDPHDTCVSDFSLSTSWSDEGEDAYWTPSEGSEGSFHDLGWSDESEASSLEHSWNDRSEGGEIIYHRCARNERLFVESQWSEESINEAKWSDGSESSFHEARWSEDFEGVSQAVSLSDSGIDGDTDHAEETEQQRGTDGDQEDRLREGAGGKAQDNRDSGVAYRWLNSFWSLEIGSSRPSAGENLVVTASRCLGRYLRRQRPSSPVRSPEAPLLPQVRPPPCA